MNLFTFKNTQYKIGFNSIPVTVKNTKLDFPNYRIVKFEPKILIGSYTVYDSPFYDSRDTTSYVLFFIRLVVIRERNKNNE